MFVFTQYSRKDIKSHWNVGSNLLIKKIIIEGNPDSISQLSKIKFLQTKTCQQNIIFFRDYAADIYKKRMYHNIKICN